VDLRRQPRYPGPFICTDVLSLDVRFLRMFDLIHASPPCQHHTAMRTMHNAKSHPDLIPATRRMLQASGVPYVIENVVGAPMVNPVTLCGTMFGLGYGDAELQRHRLFEASFPIHQPACRHSGGPVIGVYGGHVRDRRRRERGADRGRADFPAHAGFRAMGIEPGEMTLTELCQAIPPAFTRHVVECFLSSKTEIAA
jgi:DNA (cytosine-5)-methyltransferase 1